MQRSLSAFALLFTIASPRQIPFLTTVVGEAFPGLPIRRYTPITLWEVQMFAPITSDCAELNAIILKNLHLKVLFP